MAEHQLHVHVEPVAGVGLAVHPQGRQRPFLVHAHRRGEAVAVEHETTVGERARHAALPGESLVLARIDRRPRRHHGGVPGWDQHQAQASGQRQRPGGHPLPPRQHTERGGHQHEPDDHVQHDRDLRRALRAEGRDQDEAGQDGAGDGAERVHRVEPADVARHAIPAAYRDLHGAREGGADQQRGHQHRADGERDLHRQDEGRRERDRQRGDHRVGQPLEGGQDSQRCHARAELQQPEGGETERAGAEQSREDRAAECQAQQEGQQHRREGVGRAAEREAQRARPRDLVDHRGRAGDRQSEQREAQRPVSLRGVDDIHLGWRDHLGCLRRFLQRGETQIGEDDQAADREVHERGQRERRPHAERGEQHVARERGAHHRAERVERVERPHAAAERAGLGDEQAAQHRQCGAHERGGQQQQGQHQHELGEAEDEEGRRHAARQGQVRALDHRQQHRHEQTEAADADLEQAVQTQRPRLAVGEASERPAAQTEAGHERGEHGRHREDRVAEHQAQHADPENLVHEAGRTGKEEAGDDADEHALGGGAHASIIA